MFMKKTMEEVIGMDWAYSRLLVAKEIKEITAIGCIYLFSIAYTLLVFL